MRESAGFLLTAHSTPNDQLTSTVTMAPTRPLSYLFLSRALCRACQASWRQEEEEAGGGREGGQGGQGEPSPALS